HVERIQERVQVLVVRLRRAGRVLRPRGAHHAGSLGHPHHRPAEQNDQQGPSDGSQRLVAVSNGRLEKGALEPATESELPITSVLLSNQNLNRARLVAALAQYLGKLSVGLGMKAARLESEPAQARVSIPRCVSRTHVEGRIHESIDQQVSGRRPCTLLI